MSLQLRLNHNSNKSKSKVGIILLLLLMFTLSFALHLHIFNLDLVGIHVWRQTQTQTVILNFANGDNNILNPAFNDLSKNKGIIRMEFPIMQWLIAKLYNIFGSSIIITRLSSFIIGIISTLGLYKWVKLLTNEFSGIIAGWMLTFSPLFYYYTVNPLPDNLALACGIWSLFFLWKGAGNTNIPTHYLSLWGSAFFLSLATLSKLPFLIYGASVLGFLLNKRANKDTFASFIWFVLPFAICMMAPLLWYSWVIPQWDNEGLKGGLFVSKTPIAYTCEVLLHHLISTLPELILNYGSLFAFIAGLYLFIKNKVWKKRKFLPIGFAGGATLLYFLYEIDMIDKIHDYYLFPFIPFVIGLASFGASNLTQSKYKIAAYLAILGLAILPLTSFLRINSRWNTKEPGFNPIYFSHKIFFRSIIPENAKCIIGNDDSKFILLYYINRKGWTFSDDQLDSEFVNQRIKEGASYLFSDSQASEQQFIQELIEKKIFDSGGVRVYKLRQL